ncbi:LysR family transcriptional regulator [Pollutimonas sp. M17]|uniref:LysR family transcriptional regulator n=1 Tax=Pollutimonas sp. M17 TaxID=2962065 RepID=UPI0021F43308|nr:LysR family transcriptional regulator [Pollutimonas sp. M17]UYO94226.1 LysR family transcriptional regulator [Pollutimonas sp. M17]HWK71247.1 LysR family transcriptional regulator [Burkholderiaceae bacterium]
MDTLVSLRVFREIADAGSFVAAAERLSMSAPMASKHMAHLERELGVRLLNRSSRKVSLTEAGALYYEQCRNALETLELAAVAVGTGVEAPRGTLKVTAPVWFANPRIVHVMADYRRKHPEVVLDLRFTNRKVDLAAEGYDLALRVTRDPSPQLIVRRICGIRFYLVAAPSYLTAGTPAAISDLSAYQGIVPNYLNTDAFEFEGPKGKVRIRLDAAMKSDDSTFSYHAVRAGVGIGFLPGWLVEDDLKSGALVQILPQYRQLPYELYASYISRKYLTSKVRSFIDFLAVSLGNGSL